MTRKDSKGRNLHTGETERNLDGLYMYRYTDSVTGKRQTIYADDLPKLRAKEKEIQRDLEDSILTDSATKKMTVNDLFVRYMDTKILSDTTRVNYINMWNNRVKDDIGVIKVIQLKSSQVKSFYARLSRAGYSHSTIKLIHTLLYPALELAVVDDIVRKNPAKKCLSNDFGVEAKEKIVLTQLQQEKLLDFISNSNIYNVYVPLFTILLECALRCGELIGLTWDDVDLSEKVVSVNHQLIYKNLGDGCKFHISKPKTDAGIRIIPLTQIAVKAFIEQKKLNFMLGKRNVETIDGFSNFIFLSQTNNPLMPNAVNSVIYNVIDAYNKMELINAKKEHRKADLLPKLSVHNFRHTACTNMARNGMNIKVLSYIMGHAHSDITMDVYNHIADITDVKKEVSRCETTAVI